MEFKTVNTGNWITRKVSPTALLSTSAMITIIVLGTMLFWGGKYQADDWMPASGLLVLGDGQYWRLWTALFAHSDFTHLMSNLFLFLPFAYFLTGHFGFLFFPLTAFMMGGVTNFFVLKLMPQEISIIGASGVVHWMGAAWLTLAFLIDRRESWGRRLIKNLGIGMILFIPNVYRPEVSYSSHLIGFLLGILSAFVFYQFRRKEFLQAEIIEFVPVAEVDFDWEVSGEMSKR